MPKEYHIIKDWSGGSNNRKDPRDIAENENSFIQNMSIDALGKIKTAGGLYAHIEGSDGTTDLGEYIVERTATLVGSGGYGLFYFESYNSKDNEYTITDTTHPGTSDDLELGTGFGNIKFQAAQTSADDSETTAPPEYEGSG